MGPLQEALKDTSREVRRAVVLALTEFRSTKTIEALRSALNNEDFEVRMYAEEGIKRIEAADTLNPVEKLERLHNRLQMMG